MQSPKDRGWRIGQGSRYGVAGWVVYEPDCARLGDKVCATYKQAKRELARRRTFEEWCEVNGSPESLEMIAVGLAIYPRCGDA